MAAQTLTIEVIDSQQKKQKKRPLSAQQWRAARPCRVCRPVAGLRLGCGQRPAARLACAATGAVPAGPAAPAAGAAATSYRGAGSKHRGAFHPAFPGRAQKYWAPHRLTVRSKSSASHLTLSSACINRSWSDGIVCLASDCHLAAVLRAIEPVCSSSFLSSVTDTPG